MPWYLKWLSKKQLIDLIWKIIRKVFKHIYDEVYLLCKDAQRDMPNTSGLERGEWVVHKFIANHDEWKEWRFVINIVRECAHAELKKYEANTKTGIDVIKTKVLDILL